MTQELTVIEQFVPLIHSISNRAHVIPLREFLRRNQSLIIETRPIGLQRVGSGGQSILVVLIGRTEETDFFSFDLTTARAAGKALNIALSVQLGLMTDGHHGVEFILPLTILRFPSGLHLDLIAGDGLLAMYALADTALDRAVFQIFASGSKAIFGLIGFKAITGAGAAA